MKTMPGTGKLKEFIDSRVCGIFSLGTFGIIIQHYWIRACSIKGEVKSFPMGKVSVL